MRAREIAATITGLCLALGGPILLAASAGYLPIDSTSVTVKLLGQFFLLGLVAMVLALVVFWEKRPLSSIGLRPFHWQSVAWGLALGVAFIVLVPVLAGLLSRVGVPPSYESGFAKLAALPRWFLVVAALNAGVAEETLYRGYAIERLASITGSYWWAGLISLVVFTLAHVPAWGSGPLLIFLISGGVMTLFYIWRQDLLACMIAHALTDVVGLLSGVSSAGAQ